MEFTDEELRRWLLLRSIEWANWPAFLSQPVFPILVVFYWWPYVLGGVVVIDLFWALIRYAWVSPQLLNLGCMLVVLLKWPAAIGSAIYLYIQRRYTAAILALVWPLLAGFICIPGEVGRVELNLAKKIGYVDQSAEL